MTKLAAAACIVLVMFTCVSFAQTSRTAAGIVYFTNNTPDDIHSFPVQLLTPRKKVIATTHLDDHYRFAITGIAPGKYLLKLTWPNRCVLSYRIDLNKTSKTQISIIMDAACAHDNGKIRDLPPH